MATAYQGLLTLGAVGKQDERKPDIRLGVLLHNPDDTPYLTLLSGGAWGAKISALPPEVATAEDGGLFNWFEEPDIALTTTVVGAHSAAVTDITVADATAFRYAYVIRVDHNDANGNGECMWLDQNPSNSTTLNIQARGDFGTTAKAIASGARITIIGQHVPEHGVNLRNIASVVPLRPKSQNACIYSAVTLQGSFRRDTNTWIGYEMDRDAASQVKQIKRLVERNLLWSPTLDVTTTDAGGGGAGGATGSPIRYSGKGLDPFITTFRHDAGGNLDYFTFCDMVRELLKKNPGSRKVLASISSLAAMGRIGSWGMDKLETRTTDDVFGMNYTRVKIIGVPDLVIPFYWCPTLDESHMDTGFYVINLGGLRLRPFKNRTRDWNITAVDTQGRDIADPASTGTAYAFDCCMGVEVNVESNHMLVERAA